MLFCISYDYLQDGLRKIPVEGIPGLSDIYKGPLPKLPEPTHTPDQLYNAIRAILQSLKVKNLLV